MAQHRTCLVGSLRFEQHGIARTACLSLLLPTLHGNGQSEFLNRETLE